MDPSYQSGKERVQEDLKKAGYVEIRKGVWSCKEQNETLRHLRNLLARIHRDGGEYTAKHGIEKSVQDADIIVANLHAKSDR